MSIIITDLEETKDTVQKTENKPDQVFSDTLILRQIVVTTRTLFDIVNEKSNLGLWNIIFL